MADRHVVMLLSNAYRPDLRVRREAEALAGAGYRVSIICWDRQAVYPPRETTYGIDVIRVQDVRSSHGLGWSQLKYLPRFWNRACREGRTHSPIVVHCHDLDTLFAGWRLKRSTGAALIYDAHEHYPALMSLYLPGPFVRLLTWWERWLIKKADAVVTASTVLRDDFLARGTSRVVALGNHPDVNRFRQLPADDVRDARRALGVADETLLVSYVGSLHHNRMIAPFIEAASALPDIQFAIWGDGDQRSRVETAAASHPNVHYHGWATADSLPLCFQMSDIVYYGLRTDYPGAMFNAPNALSQAMISARPVIATDVGDLGRIIEATGCGMLIDTATPESIAAAIEELRSPDRRRELGERGRKAASSNYHAGIVRERLLELYETIVPGGDYRSRLIDRSAE